MYVYLTLHMKYVPCVDDNLTMWQGLRISVAKNISAYRVNLISSSRLDILCIPQKYLPFSTFIVEFTMQSETKYVAQFFYL